MKQTLTLIALIFFSLSSSAQSGTELEFSRTINERVVGEVLGPVPQGKIWKLVGFANAQNVTLLLNGATTGPSLQYTNTNDGRHIQAKLPLFFNENDEIGISAQGITYVSFIEYTVLP